MLVIGAGVTLIEAVKAADELAKENSHIRVMDPFTLKPIDKEAIITNAKAVGGKILTVEDHYIEGKCFNIASGKQSAFPTFTRSEFPEKFPAFFETRVRTLSEPAIFVSDC